ncbi:MAG TPA: hypothetical protein VGD58_15085 [Herpetosiphonaceae bacterium]
MPDLLQPGPILVQRQPISGGEIYSFTYADQPLCEVRRAGDGWKFWVTACQITYGDRRWRTQAAMSASEARLLDEQQQPLAVDRYSGAEHRIQIGDRAFTTAGTHDIETIHDEQGAVVLENTWAFGRPMLKQSQLVAPLPPDLVVMLLALTVQYGSQRGGDQIAN